MFDYLELQAFAPAHVMDLYGMSSPGCSLEEQEQELELDQDQDQEQDLSAYFPELMETDWSQQHHQQQQHQRCSQCRWKLMSSKTIFSSAYTNEHKVLLIYVRQ